MKFFLGYAKKIRKITEGLIDSTSGPRDLVE